MINLIKKYQIHLLANAFCPSCTCWGLKWNGIILGDELLFAQFIIIKSKEIVNNNLLNLDLLNWLCTWWYDWGLDDLIDLDADLDNWIEDDLIENDSEEFNDELLNKLINEFPVNWNEK